MNAVSGNTFHGPAEWNRITRVCRAIPRYPSVIASPRRCRPYHSGRPPDIRKGPREPPQGLDRDPIQQCKRRRATLPHPLRCSTIAVQGLSFRVRNGTGRLTLAMVAANLQPITTPPGDGGMWRFGNRTMDANSFRGPNGCSLPGEQAEGRNTGNTKNNMACCVIAFPPLVPVSSTPCGASTSGLSTTCSAWGVARPEAARNPNLGAGFPLRCFQRLSLPNVANRPCRWRDNRHTRGSSTQVLSYYGQASSGFQRAQRIETKLSHDVLNPARVPL